MGYRGVEGTSVGMNFELESPPADMKCPELPDHGTNNFWSASCETKQQMQEHRATCYPHCKGGRKQAPKFYDEAAKQTHSVSLRKRNAYAQQLADRACEMFKEGKSITEIADNLCRSRRLIELRLTEGGLIVSYSGPSKREQAFELWHTDPTIPDQQMMEMFRLTRNTVETYRRDFRRRHIHKMPIRDAVFNWLDENLEAKTVDIVKHFDLHLSTASEYRMKYRRSARYRNNLKK